MNNKNIDIFIRTYAKDKKFLTYSLMSIAKFVTGYNKLIIIMPTSDINVITEIINEHGMDDFKKPDGTPLEITVEPWEPVTEYGYVDQQITKLCAYQFSDADHILFVDSDCIFTQHTDMSEFFMNDKPFLLRTKWENVGDAQCWRIVTEGILGFATEHEHMRRLPMMLNRSTLSNFSGKFDFQKLAAFDRLSEFNLLGAFADKYESDNYFIIDTETDNVPEPVAKQMWSWSGFTQEDKDTIDKILNA